MSQISQYLFERKIDRDGSTLPYSRIDIGCSVVLALALMVLLSFAFEPHLNSLQKRNAAIAATVAIAVFVLNAQRRFVLGVALALIAMRLAIGAFSTSHTLVMIGLLACVVGGSYLLLRDV